MQLQQTSSVSANNDLAPAANSPPRQKNWNNTIANITGLTTGLAVFTIGAAIIIDSAIKHSDWLCGIYTVNWLGGSYVHCLDNATKFMLGNAVLSLTVGICAGKVTQLALQGFQPSPQIENKIPTEQKA